MKVENNELTLDVFQTLGNWSIIKSQEIFESYKDIGIDFEVHNLTDAPEDATVDRDLFTAKDFVNAINLGIKLSKAGIENVNINYIDEKEI